jgi:hypothetical protein
MVLDAHHQSSIYQKLVALFGDDDANALMSEFPLHDGDELITKQFLRAELAATRNDLRTELAATTSELRTELAATTSELRTELAATTSELRSELSGLRAELADVRLGMAALENRVTVRLGAAIGAQTAIMVTAMALLS